MAKVKIENVVIDKEIREEVEVLQSSTHLFGGLTQKIYRTEGRVKYPAVTEEVVTLTMSRDEAQKVYQLAVRCRGLQLYDIWGPMHSEGFDIRAGEYKLEGQIKFVPRVKS